VVFINPVPEKGLDRAIEIAAECPDIPFLFVESWTLSPEALSSLKARIAPYRNITFERRKDDVRGLCPRAVPSGAQPVARGLGSRRVRGAVQRPAGHRLGPGRSARGHRPGRPCDPGRRSELAGWVAAVRRLWSDVRHYDEMSASAPWSIPNGPT
jgi:hypothetical protein